MKFFRILSVTLIAFFFFPQPVSAHAFGAVYTLPIPFWLYLYGAASVLIVSFLLMAFFSTEKNRLVLPSYTISRLYTVRFLTSEPLKVIYKTLSLFLFFLTIITGLFGDDVSSYNFSIPFFWVIFVIGFTYLTFFVGNIWDSVNPWMLLITIYEKIAGKKAHGNIVYPKRYGYYPAFLFYMCFIAIELFVKTTPFSLSIILLQYTVITLCGVIVFGKKDWFRYGEFFSVFFRLISYCSPIYSEKKSINISLPFSQIISGKPDRFSILLFILFMLSSTAFDGLRETNIWYETYWNIINPFLTRIISIDWFVVYEYAGLIVSPFFFLGLYLVCIWLMKQITRSAASVRELSVMFAYSFLPIALVYHVAHYFTLLLLQGQFIIRLISDPFGWGWDLFGTGNFVPDTTLLDAAFVWHFQVGLILIGHIISVITAHVMAGRIFPKKGVLIISQLPMLFLMVMYTLIGLWILSQPIGITP